jgi:hypothetical protein
VAAIFTSGGVTVVTNSNFSQNAVPLVGLLVGGAVRADSGELFLEQCLFERNIAVRGSGVGMFLGFASVWITNCIFREFNSSAVSCSSGRLMLTNNTFYLFESTAIEATKTDLILSRDNKFICSSLLTSYSLQGTSSLSSPFVDVGSSFCGVISLTSFSALFVKSDLSATVSADRSIVVFLGLVLKARILMSSRSSALYFVGSIVATPPALIGFQPPPPGVEPLRLANDIEPYPIIAFDRSVLKGGVSCAGERVRMYSNGAPAALGEGCSQAPQLEAFAVQAFDLPLIRSMTASFKQQAGTAT